MTGFILHFFYFHILKKSSRIMMHRIYLVDMIKRCLFLILFIFPILTIFTTVVRIQTSIEDIVDLNNQVQMTNDLWESIQKYDECEFNFKV